ncbi:MAG: DUF5696 domain-containing protein [Limnochordia bacterium]|jgi:hypothetical protein
MRHSRWLVACGLVIIVFLALAPLVGAQGFGFGNLFGGFFGAEEEEEEEPTVAADGIPLGFSLVAENRNLELFLDADEGQLLVRDKRTEAIWRTNPDLEKTKMSVGQLWEKHLRSQVIIQYTDDKKRNKKTTNNVDQQAIVTYEPIPRGVRVVFHMQALGFQIPVEYRLGENYMEARIPDDLLLETSTYALVTIELVPFFGAATDDDTGYMVIPDSSGAVTYFKKEHPRYARQFQEFAYGPDEVRFYGMRDFFIAFNQARRQVFGPYFGLVNGSQAFLGLVTEGDFDVKINAAPSGYIVDFYRASAEFQVRKEYSAFLARTRQVQTTESRRIGTDRAVRWYLLTDEDANYVGMANTYRDYLKEKYNVVGRLGLKDDVAPIHIRLTNAVLKGGLILDELIKMTTFDQARTIVESLQASGVNNMDVTLVGWTQKGVDGIVPRHWPPERALGGATALSDFAHWATERGVDVFLEDNFLDANQNNGGFSPRNDVVRTAAKTPVHSGRRFLISPVVAYTKFGREYIPKMADLGVAGLDLKKLGELLIYDRNDTARAERADTAAAWLNIAALARKLMGRVSVQGGNAFFLAVADKVTNAPIDESTHVFVDHSIPFYQIVVHGLVPVYGYPSNLRNDPRKEYLRMVEYGMLPMFELTYEDSALLRDTSYAMLFSSQFDTWVDTVKEEFEAVNVGMGMLQRLSIVAHGQIAPNVFETGYEDGTNVIVNYNDYPYVSDSVTVPALDYLIIKGGRSS